MPKAGKPKQNALRAVQPAVPVDHLRCLLDLLALPTAPLCEEHVVAYVRAWAARRPMIAVRQDAYGNLRLRLRRGSPGGRRPLVLAAHMDHPGFEARRVLGPGRIEAGWRGGVQPVFFKQARVKFHTAGGWIRGSVTSYTTRKRLGRVRVHRVQVAVKGDVPAGSIGQWDLPAPTVRGSRLWATTCDDVAGVAAVLCALDVLSRSRRAVDVIGLLTRTEEVGFAGALGAIRSGIIPRRAMVIAVEMSSRLPGAEPGAGPVLRVGDAGSVFSPALTAWCGTVGRDLAKSEPGFQMQRKLMDGGSTEAMAYQHFGYEATGLCLALGNYHNMDRDRGKIAPEYIDLGDWANLVRWFTSLATTRRPYTAKNPVVAELLTRLEREWCPLLKRTARTRIGAAGP